MLKKRVFQLLQDSSYLAHYDAFALLLRGVRGEKTLKNSKNNKNAIFRNR
jgi:hypothetical protein